jgi:F-box protein 18 (helicase)
MNLTQEQLNIIHSSGNIKINAVAGSGKTTTIIEYAKARPKNSRILYLAFNKSVKLEAAKKFTESGLKNVQVETAHSLAYKHIVISNNYKIRPQEYKTQDIVDLLNIQVKGEKHASYIVANHINKLLAYFCNSNKNKVQDLNYLSLISEVKAKEFVSKHYAEIVQQTRILLAKMDKGEIEITHDFYLKKFQLLNPNLPYDYILFDEGQDASPAMLHTFLSQSATKVIVGDTHQQIYGWRFAVNSLSQADFKSFNLSSSFRFSQNVANLAIDILKWKDHFNAPLSINITGKGLDKTIKTKAIIARTNLGLILNAIEFITENTKIKHIYFEGNINSYTYADDGTSLYDVLNLYNGKKMQIKDSLIKGMKDIDELEDYIRKTEDKQLGMMLEMVKEYENEIYDIIKTIKSKHVENAEKHKAEIIFSTVHRCKGMEYDSVELVNDFITEEKLEKIKNENKELSEEFELSIPKLNEEINLLYVAVTRTKNKLKIHQDLMPKKFPSAPQIVIIAKKTEFKTIKKETVKTLKPAQRRIINYSDDDTRIYHGVEEDAVLNKRPKEAFQNWTKEQDDLLKRLYQKGMSMSDLSNQFNRTKGAIWSRVKKLGIDVM